MRSRGEYADILKPMDKGIFITFEGGEGCGKSSHIKGLAQYFEGLGRECVITREPGGTALSEKIRDILLHAKEGSDMSPKTEILLFAAARAQHVEQLIKPALAQGKVVISDRFYDSTTAYQGVARKLGPYAVKWLNSFAAEGATPDLTILLDLPPCEGLARASTRDGEASDRMGSQALEFYEAVRGAFLQIAKDDPERVKVVDSSGTKEETFEKIISAVEEKLDV